VQFPVTIHDGQFPAQDAAIVRVARDISVEPASVELSLQRGGNRISSLSITNQSLQRVIVESQAIPMQGFLHESLRIKPSTFQLEPNRTRKVLVMLEGGSSFDEHSYAFAEITVRPEIGEAIGSHRVPVCVLTDSKSQPQISPGELVWKATPASAGFAIPVTNRGLRHVPLEGRLSLVDGFGRGLVTEAGYGKWLLPGESSELFFGFRQPPPPGTYTVRAEISQGESLPPLQMQQTLQLSTMLQESMSTSKATPKTNVE